MPITYNETNIPINAEKRDPFYGRSKSEVGLGLVPNMSYEDVEMSILANVKATVDEGVAYNYDRYASEENPILADIVKLKPNSARTVLHFSIGTWTDNSEFISRDTATIELRSNRTNVSYNLFVEEPYPNNATTPLTSTVVVLKQFKTGGWLVSLKVVDRQIDAIWVNLVESKNIDIQNPKENVYDDSEFNRTIEAQCDRSRISTNVEIGNLDVIAKSLSHPVPIKLSPVDPNDYYNTNSNNYSLSNIDISSLIGTSGMIKDRTLVSIPILTDEVTCSNDQLIPLSVNRLNHQIKFRIGGNCVHESQRSSWQSAQSDQSNLTSFLDTDPEATNEFPISISELSHDINVRIGKSTYNGSAPESGNTEGEGIESYEFSEGKVNYASIDGSTSGRNDFYRYDTQTKRWVYASSNFSPVSGAGSLSTKSNSLSELNLVLHGLDHDIKIEAVNSDYRTARGKATDDNGLLSYAGKVDSGIRNLTWDSYDGVDDETRRNSYVTGHMNLNTFEKSIYQGLDLTVHGLDHEMKMEFYRVDSNPIKGPNNDDLTTSDRYRPNSGGHDIMGELSLDTFTSRTQKHKLEVIDSRYTDCARGLALRYDDNFMPYDQLDANGEFGNYDPPNPNADEIARIYPTINGVPFTGDFRYKVRYPAHMEADRVSKLHDTRNIIIPTAQLDPSLLAKIDETILKDETKSPRERMELMIESLTNDNEVISVGAMKSILGIICERFEKLERNVSIT